MYSTFVDAYNRSNSNRCSPYNCTSSVMGNKAADLVPQGGEMCSEICDKVTRYQEVYRCPNHAHNRFSITINQIQNCLSNDRKK